jgi:hypothetical protein
MVVFLKVKGQAMVESFLPLNAELFGIGYPLLLSPPKPSIDYIILNGESVSLEDLELYQPFLLECEETKQASNNHDPFHHPEIHILLTPPDNCDGSLPFVRISVIPKLNGDIYHCSKSREVRKIELVEYRYLPSIQWWLFDMTLYNFSNNNNKNCLEDKHQVRCPTSEITSLTTYQLSRNHQHQDQYQLPLETSQRLPAIRGDYNFVMIGEPYKKS